MWYFISTKHKNNIKMEEINNTWIPNKGTFALLWCDRNVILVEILLDHYLEKDDNSCFYQLIKWTQELYTLLESYPKQYLCSKFMLQISSVCNYESFFSTLSLISGYIRMIPCIELGKDFHCYYLQKRYLGGGNKFIAVDKILLVRTCLKQISLWY